MKGPIISWLPEFHKIKVKKIVVGIFLLQTTIKYTKGGTIEKYSFYYRYAVRGEMLDRNTKLQEHIIIGTPGELIKY